jgi:hypothetical protein
MAVYQFIIELIPERWVQEQNQPIEKLFEQNDPFFPEGCYDLSDAWKLYQPAINIPEVLSQILPAKKSWNKNLQSWGDEEVNDIQVLMNDNCIESIKFRLDLREDNENLKLKIIDLANRLSCHLFFPQLKEIEFADINTLNKAILKSNAFRFVENPREFLRMQE